MRVLILLLLTASCSFHVPNEATKPDAAMADQEKFEVIVPEATWEPIFFREINERAKIAKLPSLRTAAVPKGDLETRVWIGFGLTALRGFVIKRSAGQWSATDIRGIGPRLAKKDYQIDLRPPKSGWDSFWSKLVDAGILSLPDARSIGCESGALDGVSYVVETNMDNRYRTYMYDNPQFAKCGEAKRMLEIVDLLYREFA